MPAAIAPARHEDYAEWYQQVIRAADLAEASPTRGCMVIKPWGYALWENIQRALDRLFKDTGHVNAYFPLLIPKSFLEKEAEHVEGFAKECAVVTHHRLEAGPGGGLVPAGELEEPLIIRPTSETIIGAMYAKWVQSYRDLPVLINQWANVMRWEMRTRLFLRTAEFLWQEGHTAHETEAEAREETARMLGVYRRFAEEWMAMPVVSGRKTEGQRFPGAVDTYCIEAMMQDRKALQAGTSHFLGQNFARSSEIKFQSREGREEFAWTTSWGVSTRLIGGLIMTHGDDDGLRLPPRLAPAHVAILPIHRKDDERESVLRYARETADLLRAARAWGAPVEVTVDERDANAGDKGWQWIKKGVPLRVEIGPRDMAKNAVFAARRDQGPKDKFAMDRAEFAQRLPSILEEMQEGMLAQARGYQKEHTRPIAEGAEFKAFFTPLNAEKPEIHGGFAMSPWCGERACEDVVADALSVTVRCVPLEGAEAPAGSRCVHCGRPARWTVPWAKSY